MRSREAVRVYQGAARVWLTAAGASLLLPATARRGLWLPLHLALAGAVSVAISGAMQSFAAALTATPAPRRALVWTQFGLVNLGTALVAVGLPSGGEALVAAGGTLFVAGVLLLGVLVWGAVRRALNRRHLPLVATYLFAVASVVAGGTLGALTGSGVVSAPAASVGFRHAHMVLNVLGWASATIVATMVTLLPTVLRVRMPVWHGRATAAVLAAGVTGLALGLGAGWTALAGVGGLAYLVAIGALAWLVVRAIRTPRRWAAPVSAKHFVGAVLWFVGGSVALAVAVFRGAEGFQGLRPVFLLAFVGGWVLQTLLGAWLYLLPMGRPGHPEERRRLLAGVEIGGNLQVAAGNAGLALLVLRATGIGPVALGSVGAGLALGGAGIALLKAWAYPVMGRLVGPSHRALRVWGPWPGDDRGGDAGGDVTG